MLFSFLFESNLLICKLSIFIFLLFVSILLIKLIIFSKLPFTVNVALCTITSSLFNFISLFELSSFIKLNSFSLFDLSFEFSLSFNTVYFFSKFILIIFISVTPAIIVKSLRISACFSVLGSFLKFYCNYM